MSERDWEKDLKLCKAMPFLPWKIEHGAIQNANGVDLVRTCWRPCSDKVLRFIVEASDGWVAALEERARLEERVHELEEALKTLSSEERKKLIAMSKEVLRESDKAGIESLKKQRDLLLERVYKLEEQVRELEKECDELRTWVKKLEAVVEAAKPAAKALRFWLESDIMCECDGGIHTCGYTERVQELNELKQALAALEEA